MRTSRKSHGMKNLKLIAIKNLKRIAPIWKPYLGFQGSLFTFFPYCWDGVRMFSISRDLTRTYVVCFFTLSSCFPCWHRLFSLSKKSPAQLPYYAIAYYRFLFLGHFSHCDSERVRSLSAFQNRYAFFYMNRRHY